MPNPRVASAAVVLIICTACSSSSGGSTPQAGGSTTLPTPSACPAPTQAGAKFPAGPAGRVPHPSFAESPRLLPVGAPGEQQLRFTTAMPLRDAAAFVQKEYAAAGYQIDGGDSEAHEADILWVHGSEHGKTRLSGVTGCSTTWTVAMLPPGRHTSNADGR